MKKQRLAQAIAIFSSIGFSHASLAITVTGDQSISGIEQYAQQFNGTGVTELSYQLLNPTQTLTLDLSRSWFGGNGGSGTPFVSDGTQWKNFIVEGIGGQRELVITESTANQSASKELTPLNVTFKNVDVRFDEGRLYPRDRPGVTTESVLTLDNSKITFGGDWADIAATQGPEHTIKLDVVSGINAFVNFVPGASFLYGKIDVAKGAEFSMLQPDYELNSVSNDLTLNIDGTFRLIGNGNTATSGANKRSEFIENKNDYTDINVNLGDGARFELSDSIYTDFADISSKGATITLSDTGTEIYTDRWIMESGTTTIDMDSGTKIRGSIETRGGSYNITGIDNNSGLTYSVDYPNGFTGIASGNVVSRDQTLAIDSININNFELNIGEVGDYATGPGNTIATPASTAGSWFINGGGKLSGHIDATLTGLMISLGGTYSPGAALGDIGSMVLRNSSSSFGFSFQGATLDVELDPTATNPSLKNDKLTLTANQAATGDFTVNIDQSVNSTATTSDYDLQTFEIVDTTGVTGSTLSYSFVAGPNIPALVNFNETVNGANGYTISSSVTQASPAPSPTQVATVTATITGKQTVQNKPNAVAVSPLVATHAVTTPSASPSSPAQTAANTIHTQMQSVTNGQIGSHLNTFHPEPFASHQSINLEMAEYMANTVLARSQLETPGGVTQNFVPQLLKSESTTHNETWADTSYIEGEIDGKNNLAGTDYYLGALTIGSTLFANNQHHVGVFAGYNQQSMDEHENTQLKFDTDGFQAGVYGGYKLGKDYRASYVLGYGQMTTDSERLAMLGSVSERPQASFDTDLLYTAFRVGRVIKDKGKFEIEPFAGLSYYQSKQGEINETNSNTFAWNIEEAEETATIASLGLSVSPSSDNESDFQPSMSIRFDHDFDGGSDKNHEVKGTTISAPNAPFTFTGQGRGDNLINLDLGGLLMVTDTFHVGGGITYSWAEEGTEQGVGLNAQWLW